MKEDELKRLLERYYEGSSTEEEEKRIREFFRLNSPAGYETERDLFALCEPEIKVPEPSSGFEPGILGRIDEYETGRRNMRKLLLPLSGIAATLLLIAGSYFYISGRNRIADTYSDPAIAYAETVRILYSVSAQMNRAAGNLAPVTKLDRAAAIGIGALERSSSEIEKNLRMLKEGLHVSDTLILNR